MSATGSLTAAAVAETLLARLPGLACEVASSVDFATVYLPADRLVEACVVLRDDPAFRFTVLIEVTAADYLPRVPRFEVVYHFLSIPNRQRLRVKVRVGIGEAVPTVKGVWPAAGWPEREVWDMFGIVFDGHDDLRRLLTPDDWEGHPARKDYPVQIRKTTETYQPLEVSEAEFRANLERDRVRRTTQG
ncbi:MAG: NADH-quinone oxidoreductase subunit C [Acidobacteria bacterium]|nr:NADH-quinone oxidoreductase subunit C [Acidobacteriota bacterium]